MSIAGIHHVTAFARSPRDNMDFFARLLGLRTIKITVNYDDPATYHLYFADRIGTPGTVLTFFPHPNAKPGRPGSGQAAATAFVIPESAIEFWSSRLTLAGINLVKRHRFNEPLLTFTDPDGMWLELIGTAGAPLETQPWATHEISNGQAIRGFHSVTLAVNDSEATVRFLIDHFGFREHDKAAERTRLLSAGSGIGNIVDVVAASDMPRGSFGPGIVHHVAWRAADQDHLERMRRQLLDDDIHVTEIKNRHYFRSIYFREPGGVIFEIATNGPGFTVDESADELGSGLRLPPWMEDDRPRIAQALPPLDPPSGAPPSGT